MNIPDQVAAIKAGLTEKEEAAIVLLLDQENVVSIWQKTPERDAFMDGRIAWGTEVNGWMGALFAQNSGFQLHGVINMIGVVLHHEKRYDVGVIAKK